MSASEWDLFSRYMWCLFTGLAFGGGLVANATFPGETPVILTEKGRPNAIAFLTLLALSLSLAILSSIIFMAIKWGEK